MIPARLAGLARGPATFTFAISASTSNANLRTLANSAGYSGSGNCVATNNSGVDIFSTSTGTAALVPGSWPSGVSVTFINQGTVSGAGGGGGTGAIPSAATNGIGGGTALSASGVSGYTFSVDNSAGTLRGGGGGGGGGNDFNDTDLLAGGGGGGGGQGHNGGAGGSPGSNATAGSAGSTGSAGTGGPGGTGDDGTGATGGTGGAFGTAGSAGGAGGGSNPPGSGGAAGNSVTGNSNITWISTGTRTGPVS